MTNPVSNAQLAQLVNDSLAKWNAREAEHYAWVSGSATGGPNNDGRFPLSNGSGGSSLIDSPAKLASLLNGPAATAVSARDLALTYRDAAQASAASAASDRGLANNHRLAAQDHKDLAKQYRDDTAAHMATVEVWKNQVSTNTTAVAANTALTLGYRDEALAHRNAAQTARTAAEAAAALAATFNPTDYYTKTAADARYLQLNNFTWANLSGKPTTFAPSAHSHVIADVTGLQTALDAKLNLTGGTLTGGLAVGKLTVAADTPFYTGANINAGANSLGIGTTGASTLGLFTNNLERMRLTSTGDLLVGTTTALSGTRVVVSGGIHAQAIAANGTPDSYADGGGLMLSYAGGIGSVRAYANTSGTGSVVINFLTAGTERMRINGVGDVGIGTTSPGAKLELSGTTEQNLRITSLIDGFAATPRGSSISFRSGSTPLETARISSFNRFANFNGGNLEFATLDTANVLQTRAVIDSSGQFGIGVTPMATGANGALLQIGNPTTSPGSGLTIGSTTSADIQFSDATSGVGQYAGLIRYSHTNDIMALWTASNERMRITATGDVGIGTTAPAGYGKLAVIGNIASSADGATVLTMRATGGTTSLGSYNATGSILAFQTNLSGSGEVERMRIAATGDVGIGTSTPANYTGFTTLDLNSATNGGLLNISKGGNLVGYIHGSSGLLMLANATNISLSATGLNTIQFLTNSAERMRVTGGGDVGVGTSAPGGKLEVYQTAASPTLRLFTNFVGGNAVDLNPFITGVSNGGYSVSLAGTVRYVIDTSGNFGINTTAPTQRLDVNGSALIRGGDLFIRENPSGAGTGWRLHHNGANAFTDFDGDLNFRSGDGSVSLATLTAAGFLAAADLRGASTVSAGLSGATGRVSLVSGSATQPGYIQWNTTDGVRRGYMGWSSGTNIVYQAENGWGLQINSVITTSSNITADGVMVAKGGEITAQHNGTANTTVGIVQPGVDAMIQLGRVGSTPGTLQVNNTANTSYIYSAGGVLRIGGAGNVITLNNGGASFTSTVDFGATVNLNSVVNIPGGNLRVRSGGGDSAMGAYVGFRNSSDVERGWVGYGDGTSRMRVNNSIGDILVSANNNLELNGSIVRRFNAGAMIHHASSTFTSGAITVSTATPTGGADGDIWIRTAT